ncbi:hypothetical protein CIB48_g6323 [Xylaria polymorpha]|nr:hypothetical protein CIB48_g6323 [Xylaria polymorpha]
MRTKALGLVAGNGRSLSPTRLQQVRQFLVAVWECVSDEEGLEAWRGINGRRDKMMEFDRLGVLGTKTLQKTQLEELGRPMATKGP